MINGDLIIAMLCITAAVIIGAAGILIDRPEQPTRGRPRGQHSKRGQRRTARAAARARDEQTVTWLKGLRARRVPPLALARSRLTALAAAISQARDGEPRCAVCRARLGQGLCEHGAAAIRAATAAAGTGCLIPPPLPVDLGALAGEYRHLLRTRPPVTIMPAGGASQISDAEFGAAKADVIGRFGAIPPSLQSVIDHGGRFGMRTPNARAGNWQPRTQVPGPVLAGTEPCAGCERDALAAAICCCCGALPGEPHDPGCDDPAATAVLDWDRAIDDSGLIHLRYPWADQAAADSGAPEPREVTSRG